jgi:hypothetical protein
MEGSVLSFLKAEWKVSNTGSAHWASSCLKVQCYHILWKWDHCDLVRCTSLILFQECMLQNVAVLHTKTRWLWPWPQLLGQIKVISGIGQNFFVLRQSTFMFCIRTWQSVAYKNEVNVTLTLNMKVNLAYTYYKTCLGKVSLHLR